MTTTAPVAHIHVTCTAHAAAPPSLHRLTVDTDGSITTPDHDAEPWATASEVAAALGAEYRWSACSWWVHAAQGGAPAFWNGPHLYPPPMNLKQRLDPREWRIEPIADWTPQARATTWRALALVTNTSVPIPDTITPEQLLDACTFLSQQPDSTHWTGAIPLRPLTQLLQHPTATIRDYVAAGVPWMGIDGFITLGVDATTAGDISAALRSCEQTSPHGYLSDLYGGEDGFTERAIVSGYEPERLAGLLRRFGITPWVSQTLPTIRDYLDLHLPTTMDRYAHEYALAVTQQLTNNPNTRLPMLLQRVQQLADTEPDPLQWKQSLDATTHTGNG